MRSFLLFLFALCLLGILILAQPRLSSPSPDCYRTDCLAPWDVKHACAKGYYVDRWEYCCVALKKQLCCPSWA
ncbi:hypothetical protein L596_025373 [Steinernema carpocapsae]|uniref:Uncharacterized protein n=1 Tax=Steinernema carpocapsae TaxID=34508 RepID=A0A4U5M7L2_STECR|nr:hypothetical protein L596_025373 [Steinernema carpocapsae]